MPYVQTFRPDAAGSSTLPDAGRLRPEQPAFFPGTPRPEPAGEADETGGTAGETEDAGGETPSDETASTYEDNFDVDAEAVADFALKIQDVVADQDLEALADLMMFPNYVGFAEDPVFVNTREEFTALGAERIFTQEMCDQIAAAETEDLQPSEAGFVLSADGRPNIVFGVNEGHLAIVGMNY